MMDSETSKKSDETEGTEGSKDSVVPNNGGGAVAPSAAGQAAEAKAEIPAKRKLSRKELRMELKAARKDAKATYNQLIHLQADFENLKKRLVREREDYIRQAKEALIREILPSIDNLEYALQHARERKEDSPLFNGVEMTHKGLMAAMKKFGVEPVEAVGAAFDPNFHEAISKVEKEDGRNQVIGEHQRGYVLDRKLVRPALVTIAVPGSAKKSESGG
ncbi:MAG: nucleotide exchange factor GrpE [Nitrospirae bacterium]|nr:nucleotide exchange factor GrpE [Nitrospirota bacterium]